MAASTAVARLRGSSICRALICTRERQSSPFPNFHYRQHHVVAGPRRRPHHHQRWFNTCSETFSLTAQQFRPLNNAIPTRAPPPSPALPNIHFLDFKVARRGTESLGGRTGDLEVLKGVGRLFNHVFSLLMVLPAFSHQPTPPPVMLALGLIPYLRLIAYQIPYYQIKTINLMKRRMKR
ncbi:hypothetical protein BDN72DRAFT_384908 [Pluteus cervinus]|uniref:Uncharacterized protein n=1 Tax=Pluteus cervinus TaxID=181527 RepID=A0ACD3AAY2_9AGAR|nr:hypothetical protein BDN72DRAFT_384908 [Pluteus cervinus]